MRVVSLILLLVLAGCGVDSAGTVAAPNGAAQCQLEPLKPMIGQMTGAGTAAEALRLSGARTVRWKSPGAMVTMDYRPDRLNISLDARNRVVAFDCG